MHRGAAGHPAAVHLVVGSEALRAVAIGLPVHRAAELRLNLVFLHRAAAAAVDMRIAVFLHRAAAAAVDMRIAVFLHRAAAVDIGRQARPAAVTGLRAVLPAVGSNNLYPRS